jgi:hypothetical protein
MKTGSFLFTAIAAVLVCAAAFLGSGKSFVARSPAPRAQAMPQENSELQKTEASLERLKKIRFAGVFTPETPDRLLPSREADNEPTERFAADARQESGSALFPVLVQDASGGAGGAGNVYANSVKDRPAARNAARSAQANPARGVPAPWNTVGSGYENPINSALAAWNAAGNGYANPINSVPASVPAVENAAAEIVNAVSLTYVSPGFRRAVVDGKLVREGSHLPDGAYVARITKDAVYLTRDGKRAAVSVPRALSGYSVPALKTGQPAGGQP